MLTRQDALILIDQQMNPLGSEVFPIEEAMNVVLSEPLYSLLDVPPFHKSAMDGYAIAKGETSMQLSVSYTLKAGALPPQEIQLGTAVKVMTGAQVPQNTLRVEQLEDTAPTGKQEIRISSLTGRPNICLKGEDVQAGEMLYAPGERITSLKLANAISCGITHLTGYPVPKVGILVTGDELVDVGAERLESQIFDSNGPMLRHTLKSLGFSVGFNERSTDVLSKMMDVVLKGLEQVDVLMVSGSVSAGDFDFVPEVMRKIGAKILFQNVAIKPGKPIGCYTRAGRVIVALPGNPVAAYVGLLLFGLPVLYRLQASRYQPEIKQISLIEELVRTSAEREEFLPMRLDPTGAYSLVQYNGSAHLSALSQSNGLLIFPRGRFRFEPGDLAEVIRF